MGTNVTWGDVEPGLRGEVCCSDEEGRGAADDEGTG